MTNTMIVINKEQLIAAIKACSFYCRTKIINKRKDGGKTTFKFPAGEKAFPSEFTYNKHLASITNRIKKESKANVWQ